MFILYSWYGASMLHLNSEMSLNNFGRKLWINSILSIYYRVDGICLVSFLMAVGWLLLVEDIGR